MKKAFSISLLVIATHPSFSAQKSDSLHDTLVLSLPETWLKAEIFSRAVEIRKKEAAIANEEVEDARMERYPDIGVKGTAEKATNIPIYENGLFKTPSQHEVIHTLYRVSADFYLNIYNGNKLNLKIREERLLHEIALIEKDRMIADIRYEVASLYLDIQKSYIFLDLIREDIADQEKQLLEIKAFHKNGVTLRSDVLRVELDLSKRKMLLVEIQNDILIATQKLNILIGEPDARAFKPMIVNPQQNDPGTYEDCLRQAMEHSFSYAVSGQLTEVSKVNLDQVQANVRPQVGLYGEFYYANPQIFLYPYNPFWYSLGIAGIRVTFPISSLYHNSHKKNAAEFELDKEEELHRQTEDNLRQQVNEAYLRYREALIQVTVSEVNVEQALENARILKEMYFNQTALITDLLDADIQVLQTRFELESAKILAQTKYYLLQNIIGTI